VTPETFRERFLDSNDRFRAAMLDAIRAHQAGVVVETEAVGKLDELLESVNELKHLIMEQGAQIQWLGEHIRSRFGDNHDH
jgi:hypothetical protein